MSTGLWATLYIPTAPCTPIPLQTPEKTNHGWNVWSNDSFISFTPTETAYCIEPGWEPIGASVAESGRATFPIESSGVVIKTSELTSHTIKIGADDTTIRVLFPIHMSTKDSDEYLAIIKRVFNGIGDLYKNFETSQLTGHTVLISEGIAGDGTTIERSVYPTPTKDLTVFVRNKNHWRGEELFIHAVAHLYNRHSTSGLAYQNNQSPVPKDDWQEAEAAWAEIVLRSDHDARSARVQALHAIHESVVSGVFSPALDFPFNSKKVYEEVERKSVILGVNPTYGEIQYSHYVLAPLLLLAIEGLLEMHSTETTVSALLTQAREENQNFFALVSDHLPEEVIPKIDDYIFGREPIPYELLQAGLSRYEGM